MAITVSPNQDEIFTVLRAFLLSILPSDTEVIKGQANKVPEPTALNFVVTTVIHSSRIETNITDNFDAIFEGSIEGSKLTITRVGYGTLHKGSPIQGVGVDPDTRVTNFVTGEGGVGTYTVSPTQDVAGPIALGAGEVTKMQPSEYLIQCDVHGPMSSDNAEIISTLCRDEYAVEAFALLSDSITPLLADDRKQAPFFDGEQQYEDRWIVEVLLQANQTVSIPQQFADALEVVLVPLA